MEDATFAAMMAEAEKYVGYGKQPVGVLAGCNLHEVWGQLHHEMRLVGAVGGGQIFQSGHDPLRLGQNHAVMLPYKSLCFTGMKDRHGLYAVIGKDENRDKEVRRPRASIRRQLSETKQAQALKKAPARTKKNELEV